MNKKIIYKALEELVKYNAISDGEMVRIWSDYQVNKN